MNLSDQLPGDTNELLTDFRKAQQAYEDAESTMGKDHAALTAMGKAAELDRLLSAGGHLPDEWRNARR
jgi:hypothetical protein